MRVIKGLDHKEVCGISILVPVGEESADFSKLISLNDTSDFLWKQMENGEFTAEELTRSLVAEYDVDAQTASADVETFISPLRKEGLIEE